MEDVFMAGFLVGFATAFMILTLLALILLNNKGNGNNF